MENNFILNLENEFCEENQIEEQKIEIDNESFSIFYIDSLINKTLFASSVLAPIEKIKKEISSGIQQENSGNQMIGSEQENTSNQISGSGQENINEQKNLGNQKSENEQSNSSEQMGGNEQENSGNQMSQSGQENSINQMSVKEEENSGGEKNANNQTNSQKNDENNLNLKIKNAITISGFVETQNLSEIKNYIFSGYAVVVFKSNALAYPIIGIEKRGVEEPPSSKVVKGPREGFVEDISTNNGLIRKRIKSSDLNIINVYVGERSKTLVSIYYLKGVAKDEIVKQVVKIIKSISIDAVIDSYYIVSYLEGDKLKFFKRVGNTEKPDIFCSKILEGRVGIMVDGSPIALTVPFILIEDLQSAGDYYSIPAFATFTRIMRFIGLIIAILIPGIYVSLQSYNYRILPINFLITLLSSIEGLSVPPLLEILLVLFLFEIITEASVRMPNAMGMALSIIGALALGNTAVDAGIISPPSIVIVAISSVALHIIPDQFDQTRILRILFTTIGGIVGLYGIYVGVLFLVTYLCSIESFGVYYLSPYSPSIKSDKKDGFIMQPIQRMKYRPILMSGKDKIRQGKKR